tara:strand:- start:1168 stop:1824 length:657 start_codon:yes stop_codon:yes gene_type:complete
MEKHILIGTPAFGGQVYSCYTRSLIGTFDLLKSMNIKCSIKFIDNQIVTRARNMITKVFMDNEEYTHLLFIDADIEWDPMSVILLLSHDKDCIIGLYPTKGYDKQDEKLSVKPSSVIESSIDENSPLVKVKYAATGFMLIKKNVFNIIDNKVEKFNLTIGKENIEISNYFDTGVVDKQYLTEDYYFSHIFANEGGEIYADMRVKLYHYGTHAYGSLIC